MRLVLTLCLLAAPMASARPTVVELFTSLACSSCPPADAVLVRLAPRPDILALSFDIDYWNRLGWPDPYALASATSRQRTYAARLGSEVYTPQAVVDGSREILGSDERGLAAAIAAAQRAAPPAPDIRIVRTGAGLRLTIGNGTPARPARVLLLSYTETTATRVGGGENGGRTLVQTHVVRTMRDLGEWKGEAWSREVPASEGQKEAVLLQDDTGAIVGAASDRDTSS